ncbi:MAG: T9SS type A sorting domain-containing protein [candidate division WOR-3 bacterium]
MKTILSSVAKKGRGMIPRFLFSLLFLSFSHSQVWKPPIRISTDTLSHIVNWHVLPYLAAEDSILWVAWYAFKSVNPDTHVVFSAYYDGRVWSRPIVVDRSGDSILLLGVPAITIIDDGTPRILFGRLCRGPLIPKLHWSWYDGERWQPPQRVTNTLNSEEDYDFVSLPDGRMWAVWIGGSIESPGLVFTATCYYDGDRWNDPIIIDTFNIETPTGVPRIASGRNERVWVLWQKMRATFSSVYDTSWSSPETVFTFSRYHVFDAPPAVCCDSFGNIWAAEGKGDSGIIVARNDGSGWRDYQVISEPGVEAYAPDMVCDSSGRVWVVWCDGQIRARYYERGRWSAITTVCPDTWWYNGYPTIAATNREIWVLWDHYDPITRTDHIYGSYTHLSEIGIGEGEKKNYQRQVYPIILRSSSKISLPPNSSITIYDIRGDRVKSFSTFDSKVIKELRGLESGIYFLRLNTDKDEEIKKIILLR